MSDLIPFDDSVMTAAERASFKHRYDLELVEPVDLGLTSIPPEECGVHDYTTSPGGELVRPSSTSSTGSTHSTSSTSSNLDGRLSELVRTLKAEPKPPWEVPFYLARVLRAVGDDPMLFETVAGKFFEALGSDPMEGWAGLLAVFDKVRYPDGVNPFALATAQAKACPRLFKPTAGVRLAAIATTAWNLSVAAEGGEFLFPVKLVAEHFELAPSVAAYAINGLVKAGVLRVTDPEWIWAKGKKGKARKFAFAAEPVGFCNSEETP